MQTLRIIGRSSSGNRPVRVLLIAVSTLALAALWISPLLGEEKHFSVLLKGNFTTSSKLYPNPNAADPELRALSFPIEDFFGYSIELKYQIPDTHIAVSLSADYISATADRSLPASPRVAVPISDGYRVVPIDLTGYFVIPASGSTVGIFMGGGIGAYFGHRIYRLAGEEAPSVSEKPGFGIHVLGGVSVRLTEFFSIVGEMKFRDVQFESSNAFKVSQVTYRDFVVNVSQKPFDSRIHTDGIVFQLGAAIDF